jgi:hypothetical protein
MPALRVPDSRQSKAKGSQESEGGVRMAGSLHEICRIDGQHTVGIDMRDGFMIFYKMGEGRMDFISPQKLSKEIFPKLDPEEKSRLSEYINASALAGERVNNIYLLAD